MVEEWARIIAERAEELGLGSPAPGSQGTQAIAAFGSKVKLAGLALHHLQFEFSGLRILIRFSSVEAH